MSAAKARKKLREQGKVIRQELQLNRMLIAKEMGNREDVFPRSVAMQLITQQKMSDIIPLYNMSLVGLRIFKFISAHNTARKRLYNK